MITVFFLYTSSNSLKLYISGTLVNRSSFGISKVFLVRKICSKTDSAHQIYTLGSDFRSYFCKRITCSLSLFNSLGISNQESLQPKLTGRIIFCH